MLAALGFKPFGFKPDCLRRDTAATLPSARGARENAHLSAAQSVTGDLWDHLLRDPLRGPSHGFPVRAWGLFEAARKVLSLGGQDLCCGGPAGGRKGLGRPILVSLLLGGGTGLVPRLGQGYKLSRGPTGCTLRSLATPSSGTRSGRHPSGVDCCSSILQGRSRNSTGKLTSLQVISRIQLFSWYAGRFLPISLGISR